MRRSILSMAVGVLLLAAGAARAEQVLIDGAFGGAGELPAGGGGSGEGGGAEGGSVVRLVPAGGLYRVSHALGAEAAAAEAFYRVTVKGRSVSRTPPVVALKPATGKTAWTWRPDVVEVVGDAT